MSARVHTRPPHVPPRPEQSLKGVSGDVVRHYRTSCTRRMHLRIVLLSDHIGGGGVLRPGSCERSRSSTLEHATVCAALHLDHSGQRESLYQDDGACMVLSHVRYTRTHRTLYLQELVDDFGHKVFETISITLVCGTIVATTQ